MADEKKKLNNGEQVDPEKVSPEEEAKLLEKVREKQEKADFKRRIRSRRAERALNNRKLKNMLLWLFGLIVGVIVTVSGILACFLLVPIKDWLSLAGQKSEDYVSEEIGGKSLFDAVLNVSSYKVSDVPAVKELFKEIENLTGFVKINTEAEDFNDIRFLEPGKLLDHIRISPSILGDEFSRLDLFKWTKVLEEDKPNFSSGAISRNKAKMFYYITSGTFGHDAEYALAVKEDGTGYVDGVDQTFDLYYSPITDYPLSEIQPLIGPRFNNLTVKSILKTFDTSMTDDSMIAKILGDVKISNISSIGLDDVALTDVLPQNDTNKKLFDVLLDCVNAERSEGEKIASGDYDAIKVSDLSALDINNLKLGSVLPEDENQDLYAILGDALGGNAVQKTIAEISGGLDFTAVKLKTVIKDEPENDILKTLWNKDVTLNEIGDELNDISVTEIFDAKPFTKLKTETKDSDVIYLKNGDQYTLLNAPLSGDNFDGDDLKEDNDYYYLSKTGSIWAFVLCEGIDPDVTEFTGTAITKDGTGLCDAYEFSDVTLGELNSKLQNVSLRIMGSTVREIYLFGIIDDEYSNIRGMKITDVMENLNSVFDL